MRNLFSAVVLLSSLLGGCATYDIKSTSIDYTQPLPTGSGVVVLQVVNNTDRLAPLHKGWTEVIAIRTDNVEEVKARAIAKAKQKAKEKQRVFDESKVKWDPDFYSFVPVQRGTEDSQLFMGSMPKGEYVISSLFSFYTDGNMSSWITMPVFKSAGAFSVENESLTDLGTILFQPLLSVKEKSFWSSKSSSKAFVTRSFEKQALGDLVLDGHPAIAQQVANNSVLSWNNDEFDEIRLQLSKLAAENAYANTAINFNQSNRKALAAKFGLLNLIDAEGTWKTINLPTNSQLYAALEINGHVLLGSELGQVYQSSDMEKWELIRPVSQEESIIWFGSSNQHSYALTSSAKNYQLYQIADLTTPWKSVGKFTKKNAADFLVQNGGLFPFISSEGQVHVINDVRNYVLNEEDMSWTHTRTKPMRKMEQMPNGTLVGLAVSQWDGIGSQVVSTDNASSWISLKRSLFTFGDAKADAILPIVTDDGKVITLGRAGKKIKGQGNRKLSLIATNLDGLTSKNQKWKPLGLPKEECQTTLPLLSSTDKLFFLCDQGQVVSTTDFGKSWVVEIDRDIAQMQEQYDSFIEELKEKEENEKQNTANEDE